MSVGDGPQTPDSWEQDWEVGRADWEERMGWDIETQDCASTQDDSSREDPGEALDDTPGPDSAHYPFHTEEYSSMILWEPSRGLLMEKVIGRYRFMGGVNEPFLSKVVQATSNATHARRRGRRGRTKSQRDGRSEQSACLADTPYATLRWSRGKVEEVDQATRSDPERGDWLG